MLIISDTTQIISLLKINRLELLRELFDVVWIPNAVFDELISNKNFKTEAIQIKEAEYMKKVAVQDTKSVGLLRRATGLDAGESEAIILSDENEADILLMDEAKGRLVARQMGLKIMGTIGILMTAYEEEILSADEILQCVEILRMNGRHISEKLYKQLIDKLK